MTRLRALLVMGTRPEAIKMAPVVAACAAPDSRIEPVVCFTGQHDEMLRQVTDYFSIRPDYDLKVMQPGQSLALLTSRLITALDETIAAARPDWVVVQGDTTSVLAASLAAFYRRVPLVHVEAGLRTGNVSAPWPEEFNRRAASIATRIHCAPTARAAQNLLNEGVSKERIRVTGNTVIDALLMTLHREQQHENDRQRQHAWLEGRDMVLITAHRRENHGAGLDGICTALAWLATQFSDTAFVFPVHLNPSVQDVVRKQLAGIDNVRLLAPLAYPEFVWLMNRSKLIISDSGGVQEEAPSLKRPVVALRETTERQEAVEAGGVVCVGCQPQPIIETVSQLLTDPAAYAAMQVAHSPFGDGHAAERIIEGILEESAL